MFKVNLLFSNFILSFICFVTHSKLSAISYAPTLILPSTNFIPDGITSSTIAFFISWLLGFISNVYVTLLSFKFTIPTVCPFSSLAVSLVLLYFDIILSSSLGLTIAFDDISPSCLIKLAILSYLGICFFIIKS